MSQAAIDWTNRWITDWTGTADHDAWSLVVGVRGLTDAQLLRRIDFKLRDAMDRRVASLTIQHDLWTGRLIGEALAHHPDVGFVYRRSGTETLVYLRHRG